MGLYILFLFSYLKTVSQTHTSSLLRVQSYVCITVKNASQQIAHAVIKILNTYTLTPANQQDCCDASDWRCALWVGLDFGGGV